jgi:hypothetical protein
VFVSHEPAIFLFEIKGELKRIHTSKNSHVPLRQNTEGIEVGKRREVGECDENE